MNTKKETKLRKLFKNLHQGKVITIPLLDDIGISDDLRKYYIRSGWLEIVGRGAYKKPDDVVEWYGAINAIQKQTEINVHVGGLSALYLQGFSHYIRLGKETLYLISPQRTKLPKWFKDYNWNTEIFHKTTSFLPDDVGLKEIEIKHTTVEISTPERAIMECLYLAPKNTDLMECYQIFEGLVNLKPKLIIELLKACKSVKVKRLFLYMAEKANHQWFNFLKLYQLDLGSGKRMITEKGIYNAKYLISIPKELVEL